MLKKDSETTASKLMDHLTWELGGQIDVLEDKMHDAATIIERHEQDLLTHCNY